MHLNQQKILRLIPPSALFLLALGLRLYFFSGFILCDDVEFFQLTQVVYTNGLTFQGVLQYRFMVWLPHLLGFHLLGMSEAGFMLPLWLFSSSLSPLAYFLMRRWGYPISAAFFTGLVVASAPFEVLIGTVVSNDLTLEWLMAIGFIAFTLWKKSPVRLGLAWAILLWLGFYTKLWVVYGLPLLGVHYLIDLWKRKVWRGLLTFMAAGLVLHLPTVLLWKWKMGMFFPFLSAHSATYAVPTKELTALFAQYPQLIFEGSQFGTTLFGWLPYLWLLLLAAKLLARSIPSWKTKPGGMDTHDMALLALCTVFFLMLNFFPNAFRFDRYYSMPRIFRYLAPLSWPLALHSAKMVWDLSLLCFNRRWKPVFFSLAALLLIALNVLQTHQATGPGRQTRSIQVEIIRDLRRLCPPKILIESWQSFFLQHLYLQESCASNAIVPIVNIYQAVDHEDWLARNETALPGGTILISGIGSCVHYTCYNCGFRLVHFNRPLSNSWKLLREYASLSYLPQPEPVRLWQLAPASTARQGDQKAETGLPAIPSGFSGGAQEAFPLGMRAFEKAQYPAARQYFDFIRTRMPDSALAEDAFYFYAVTFWREANFPMTIAEFQKLLDKYPQGRQAAGAHYHIALAYKEMRKWEEARQHLQIILDQFSQDETTYQLAKDQIRQFPSPPLWDRLKNLIIRTVINKCESNI